MNKAQSKTKTKTVTKTSSKKKVSTTSAPQPPLTKDASISVRKIENGHIVSESGTTGTGKNQKWFNREYYSAQNPVKVSSSLKQPKFGSKK